MEPHADVRAPGAAVTVALCGHWEHEPCPLAPHHVSAHENDGELRVGSCSRSNRTKKARSAISSSRPYQDS